MARWWNPSANSNSNVTSAWSATKGGPTGASVPGINDDVHFTSGNNKNCTINANHIWKSVTFDEDSGYSGQLSMSGIRYINVNGNFILSSAMTFGATIPDLSFGGTTYNIDFKGKTWKNQVSISNNGTVTLLSDFNNTGYNLNLSTSNSILKAISRTIRTKNIINNGLLDFSSNTIYCTTYQYGSASSFADTSDWYVTNFRDNSGNTSYKTIHLVGSYGDIAAVATDIIFDYTGYQEVELYGDVYVANPVFSGNSSDLKRIYGNGSTLYYLGSGKVSLDYIEIDNTNGSPDLTWYLGTHSVDDGGNNQIYFTDPPPLSFKPQVIFM